MTVPWQARPAKKNLANGSEQALALLTDGTRLLRVSSSNAALLAAVRARTVMFTFLCKHLKFFHVFKGLRCFFQFRCKQKGVFRSVVYSSCEAHLSLLQRGGGVLCCLSIAWRSEKNTFTSAPSASHHSMSSTASSLRSPTSQRLTYC